MTTKSLYRVCWLCKSLANNKLQSQLTPSINIIAFMSRFAALKAKNGNFIAHLWFFCLLFLSLWIVAFADAVDSSFVPTELIADLCEIHTIMKNFIEWILKSVQCLSYQSDINDLNCNNLIFTTAYLTEWLPVWVHWTQFFK